MATTRRPLPDVCRLSATIRGAAYTVTPVRAETPDVGRAWRLRRRDGESYVVADTLDGATCECADFAFRHDGLDSAGCKHVRALRALNLIDPEDGGPESWPAWTDSHAFTVTR